jgi:hypothetical protein
MQMGAVGRGEVAGLIGERVPGKIFGPGEGEAFDGQGADRLQRLAELPVGDAGGAAEGVEKGGGAIGGGGAVSLEPEAGPPAAIRQGAVADAGGGEVVVVGIGEGGHGFGKERDMEDAGAGGDGRQLQN